MSKICSLRPAVGCVCLVSFANFLLEFILYISNLLIQSAINKGSLWTLSMCAKVVRCVVCSVSCVVLCGVGGDHYNTVCRGWQEPPTGPRAQSRLDPGPRNRQLLHIQQQHISRCYQGTGILPLSLVMGSDTPVPVMLYKFGWTRKCLD